nr:hypothetical protein [Tanacetum cinerariifolium]
AVTSCSCGVLILGTVLVEAVLPGIAIAGLHHTSTTPVCFRQSGLGFLRSHAAVLDRVGAGRAWMLVKARGCWPG